MLCMCGRIQSSSIEKYQIIETCPSITISEYEPNDFCGKLYRLRRRNQRRWRFITVVHDIYYTYRLITNFIINFYLQSVRLWTKFAINIKAQLWNLPRNLSLAQRLSLFKMKKILKLAFWDKFIFSKSLLAPPMMAVIILSVPQIAYLTVLSFFL